MRNQVVAGQERRDDRARPSSAAAASASIPASDGVARWSAETRPELGGELRAAATARARRHGAAARIPYAAAASRIRRDWSAREDAVLAEDVAEARPALGGDAGELLLDDDADVRLRAVRAGPGTRAARRGRRGRSGTTSIGPSRAEPVGDLEQAELGRQVEAVAGLRLDRGRRRGRASRRASAGRGPAARRPSAARVAATVERIPPPAARISR